MQKLGYEWDNYGDWGKSVQAANTSDPISVANNTLQVGAPRTVVGTLSARF